MIHIISITSCGSRQLTACGEPITTTGANEGGAVALYEAEKANCPDCRANMLIFANNLVKKLERP